MKRLFLTSSFDGSGDFLKHVLPIQNKNHTVAYIGNAADLDEDKSWMQSTKDKFKELNFELTEVDLRKIQNQDLQTELEKYDCIYVEGGNNVYLLEISNNSGLTKIVRDLVLKKDKIYIGTSAGSIHAGPSIESTMILDEPYEHTLTSFEALNLVNFVVVPHIGGDFNSYRKKEYTEMYNNFYKFAYPHLCLRDNQAVWVEDNKVEVVSI